MEMTFAGRQAAAATSTCPVCARGATLYDVVDFNKSCSEAWGAHRPLTGRPVYYHRCGSCGFVYAEEFQAWSSGEFAEHIYNEAYIEVDPDFVSKRPVGNAQFIATLFGDQKSHIRHLDYGGGNGLLSQTLAGEGWQSTSYDPYAGNAVPLESLGKFNLITAFEVFEHVADVQGLMDRLGALMDEQCVLIFSTLLSDEHLKPNGRLDWWYASPRNGHISLFSKQSLVDLATGRGLDFGSFNPGLHCFFNSLPNWSRKLLG